MKYFYLSLSVVLLTSAAFDSKAQELNFSQYFNQPLFVNPANTGFSPDIDVRYSAAFKNQWQNILSNPYKSQSIWSDIKLYPKKNNGNNWIGMGCNILKDQAGSSNLTSTKIYTSFALHQYIDYYNLLSIGIGIGFINKSVDKNKLIFDNQWNGKFFDVANPLYGNENFQNTVTNYVDFNIGIKYTKFISDDIMTENGINILHINRPKENILKPDFDKDGRVPLRFIYDFDMTLKMDGLWLFNPNIYINYTSSNNAEYIFGVNANRIIDQSAYYQLILGAYYRLRDALIPLIGFQVNDYKATLSYDLTVSQLATFNGRKGGYELSLLKNNVFKGKEVGIRCPRLK